MAQLKTVSLGDKRFDEIGAAIRTSYPNACILWVDEVDNPFLARIYKERRELITQQREAPPQELMLFHGTSEEALQGIVRDGFNPDFNRVSAYGKGTYFARDADYSKNYAKPKKDEISYMFMAKVLVGNCTQGTNNATLDTTKYDNFVNSLTAPSIYVTPHLDGCYPQYVVAFHRNAK